MTQAADTVWRNTLYQVLSIGRKCSPRNMGIMEILGHNLTYNSLMPIVTDEHRKLNYSFMVAEARWILSGDDSVKGLDDHCKLMRRYSNDGLRYDGAYGPPFRHQLRYVVDKLLLDRDSRQAVMTIWNRNPRESLDIPCTVSLQFLIREGTLNTIVSMRSSDAWIGLPYDMFNFAMMTHMVRVSIAARQPDAMPAMGDVTIFAGSRHIYEKDKERVNELLIQQPKYREEVDDIFYEDNTPDGLLNTLGMLLAADKSLFI